jgi:hypothetical protein
VGGKSDLLRRSLHPSGILHGIPNHPAKTWVSKREVVGMIKFRICRAVAVLALIAAYLSSDILEARSDERSVIESAADKVLGGGGSEAKSGPQDGAQRGANTNSGAGTEVGWGTSMSSGSGGGSGSGEPTPVDPFPCPPEVSCKELGCDKKDCASYTLDNGCPVNRCRTSVLVGDDKKPICPPEWLCNQAMIEACKSSGGGCKNVLDKVSGCEFGKCEGCKPAPSCPGRNVQGPVLLCPKGMGCWAYEEDGCPAVKCLPLV